MGLSYVLPANETVRSSKAGIYKITNLSNGKIYIGSAINLQKRFLEHRRLLEKGEHKNSILQNAWNKGSHFSFEVLQLFTGTDKKELQKLEQLFLDKYQPFKPKGYNICKKVIGPVGVKRKPLSAEHRKKLSVAATGRKHTKETKEKCRIANLGKVYSLERCAAISKGRKGINRGVPRTQAVRDKISAAQKGRSVPNERRKRISESVKMYYSNLRRSG